MYGKPILVLDAHLVRWPSWLFSLAHLPVRFVGVDGLKYPAAGPRRSDEGGIEY